MLSLINQFVYRPDVAFTPPDFTPADVGLVYEETAIETADGLKLAGWYLPAAKASHALLYCHGNAGTIGDWIHVAPPFLEAGISLLLWDYRGYGRSQGQPSEKGLYLDGLAAWAWLKQRAAREGLPVSMLGKSLGSAVVINTAAQERPAAVILDSAFTSMREVIAGALSGLDQGRLAQLDVPPLYESLALVSQINSPTLVIHGHRDALVPLNQGRRLFEALAGRKAMVVIEHAGHNDISSFPQYHQAINDFLAGLADFARE
jgi:uncharacterized protein